MIDATKLLGGLLSGSLNSPLGRLDSPGNGILPGKGAIGMGLLGVAIAAYEHFTAEGGNRTPPPGSPPDTRPAVPPPPPPPPGGYGPACEQADHARTATPPPPPSKPEGVTRGQPDPALLIRAMIASAHADGILDGDERERIVSRLECAGLSGEETEFLRRELDSPRPMSEIVTAVDSPASAAQVYAVSLLSVEVDTEAEKTYLEALRRALRIDEAEAASIARRMGR